MVGLLQQPFVFFEVTLEILRVGELMEMAAKGRLRFVLFRPGHRIEAPFARANPGIAPKEIHGAIPKPEHLGHPRVVVALPGYMAIAAILCCSLSTRRMREMRIECLAAITFSADRLLLGVNPLAVRILRADDHRAGRAQHREPMIFHRAVHAQLENIVADDLRIVGREIARRHTLKFIERHFLVGAHRQMTAKTARGKG